jgi:hypothetical protein
MTRCLVSIFDMGINVPFPILIKTKLHFINKIRAKIMKVVPKIINIKLKLTKFLNKLRSKTRNNNVGSIIHAKMGSNNEISISFFVTKIVT